MKEPLSHSEIERIIDEQERELDSLLHESWLKDSESESQTVAPGRGLLLPAQWVGRFWKWIVGLFNKK